jgi:hypothetical protein
MRTYITEYDLSRPPATIWGLTGYTHVNILVRNHGRPLDILRVTKNPASAALTELDLEREIDDRLGISVTLRSGFDRSPAHRNGMAAISVIVCTAIDPALRRCWALCPASTMIPEVIVIDNASRTSRLWSSLRNSVRYVRESARVWTGPETAVCGGAPRHRCVRRRRCDRRFGWLRA